VSRVSVSFDAFSNGFWVFYFFVFVFPTVSFLKLNRFSFSFLILVSFSPFVCPFFWHTRGFLFCGYFPNNCFVASFFLVNFSSLFRSEFFCGFFRMFLSRWKNGSSFSFFIFCSVENRTTKEILKKQKRIHENFEREKAFGVQRD
jgi:hypothetical protein